MRKRGARGHVQQFTLVTQLALGSIPWTLALMFTARLVSAGVLDSGSPVLWCLLVLHAGLMTAATVALVSMRRPPAALPAVSAVVGAGELAAAAAVTGAGGPLDPHVASLVCGLIMVPLASTWACTGWRTRTGCAVLSCAAVLPANPDGWVTSLVVSASVWGAMTLGVHSSLWSLAVVRRLDGARRTASRLAVAEERLRIARDLHDVIGRDLAVVALKSELAARFAEEVPQAKSELEDIRQVVRRSQEQVREVVHGYRDTSLASELEGAASVLEAAGITCRIQQDLDDTLLADRVRAGLGWSIREGVTNVIRHSRATVCTIRLLAEEGHVRMTISNDRALEDGDGSGTGLVGLAERLDGLGGALRHGGGPKGTYRLQVTVPHRRGEAP